MKLKSHFLKPASKIDQTKDHFENGVGLLIAIVTNRKTSIVYKIVLEFIHPV